MDTNLETLKDGALIIQMVQCEDGTFVRQIWRDESLIGILKRIGNTRKLMASAFGTRTTYRKVFYEVFAAAEWIGTMTTSVLPQFQYKTFRTTPTSDGQTRWAVQAHNGLVLGYITHDRDGYAANTTNMEVVYKLSGVEKIAEAAHWIASIWSQIY